MKSLTLSKRLLLVLSALLPIGLGASAHAKDDDDSDEGGAAGDDMTLRIRTAAPEKSPWGELLSNVAQRIKTDSKDRIKVKIYWQVKSEASAVRACTKGKAGGIAVSLGAIASAVPELDATEIPYLFDDYKQADKALEAARPLMTEILAAKGFVFAIRGENGFRQWASKTSFLTTPTAFKGRTMRSQPSSVHKAMYSALGATPSPLQISEVPTSLTNGAIDGYDNTLLFARLANWSDGVQYITMSNHIYQGAAVVWCQKWFEKLPADLREIMTRRDAKTIETEKGGLALVRVFNDKLMPEQYKKANKQMKELSGGERAALKAALASVETDFAKSTSDKGRELLKVIKANR